MDWNEFNKIFGALTGAFAVFLGVTFITEGVFYKGHHDELAFAMPLEGVETAEAEEEPEEEISLATLLAAGDSGSGAKVFRKCQACHSIDEGGKNGTGPALWGVMGREIGVVAGYSYSDAMGGHGGVWDWEAMNAFLEKPKDWLSGTKMNFAGLKKPEDRADVMVYLNENSGAPLPKPENEASAGAAEPSAN